MQGGREAEVGGTRRGGGGMVVMGQEGERIKARKYRKSIGGQQCH